MVLFSCEVIQPETPGANNPSDDPEYVAIRVVNENADVTKAYYYEESDYWTYVWEDYDTFNYFYYKNGNLLGNSDATVFKSPDATVINYEASNLKVGNIIYTYFLQADLWMNSIENDNPNAVKLVIPTTQVSSKDPESLRIPVDCAFDLTNISLKNQTASIIGGALGIPSNTLYFTIENFKPELKDYYSATTNTSGASVSSLTIDDNGNGSVNVSFLGEIHITNTTKTVCVRIGLGSEYEGNYVEVNVTALKKNLSVKYSWAKGTPATSTCYKNVFGETKPYPIRDCMPCASKAKIITNSLLKHPEDIANSMTMYMLGSAAEFRIYSNKPEYVGEDILSVTLESLSGPFAGYCYYDLASEDLTLTGFDAETIVSDVTACGYKVPAVKGDEESVYLVIAPGTYSFLMTITTKDGNGQKWDYVYTLENKTFTRANRKPFGVNLASANCSRIQHSDASADSGEEEEDEAESGNQEEEEDC